MAALVAVSPQLGRLVIDDVLVFDRDGRDIQAKHLAGFACVVAGGAHHVLAGDVALVGEHIPFARCQLLYAGDLGLLIDLAATGAGALAQGHGQIDRGNVAVVRVVERADHLGCVDAIAQIDQGPQRLDLGRGDDAKRHANGVGHTTVLEVLVHPVLVGRQPQVAGDMKAHILPGLGRQTLVQVHRVLV